MKYDHQSLSKDIPVKDVIAWLKDAIAWLVKRRWTAFLLGLAPSSLALLMLPAVPNSIGSPWEGWVILGPLYFCFFFKPGLLDPPEMYKAIGLVLAIPCLCLMCSQLVKPNALTAFMTLVGFGFWYFLGLFAMGLSQI